MESKKTTEVSQQVESDATPRTPGSSVSFEVPLIVTRDENYVAGKDTEETENQRQFMSQVQDFVVAKRGRRNPQKFVYLTQI